MDEEEHQSLEYEEDCYYSAPSFEPSWTDDEEAFCIAEEEPCSVETEFRSKPDSVKVTFQDLSKPYLPRVSSPNYRRFLQLVKAVEAPLDMSPDSGINELQGLTPEEQERQRKEWQDELVKLQTFEVEAPHETAEEVSDGFAVAQALTRIAPDWFDEVWMSKIKRDTKIEDLRKMADETIHLKEKAYTVGKPEATIESYKKRLEEVGDLRRQVKKLEDNTEYMQQNMELEEEIRKSGILKPQLELYKKQVAELDLRLADQTKRGDKIEFENKKLQEKLNSLQRENQRLVVECNTLRETNEELKCTQLQQQGNNTGTPDTLLAEDMISPEIKEKLVRLQHENKILKLNQRCEDDEAAHRSSNVRGSQ